MFLSLVELYAVDYSVYGLNGQKLGVEKCTVFSECLSQARQKYSQQAFLVNKKSIAKKISIERFLEQSQDTIQVQLNDSTIWIETEKNKIESICVDDSSVGTWVVSNETYRIQGNNCIQINTGNLVNTLKFQYVSEENVVYTFNVLAGMKYIDLSKTQHLLGYYGSDYELKKLVHYLDPVKNFNNKIFPDPIRKEAINEKLIVDKFLVTNCEFIQTLWNSIPEGFTSKNNNIIKKNYTHWMEKKNKMVKGSLCDAHDSAAIKIYLYDALIYANARSVRDGFEPVYSFEAITQKYYFSDLYENGDFDVLTTSFFKNYDNFDYDNFDYGWYRVKVNKNANGYRLPYYNEWMALARGGTMNYHNTWEDSSDPQLTSQYAWYNTDTSKKVKYEQDSRPVGKLKPNGYGLYDVLGLVCENVMFPGKQIFKKNEITTCKGGSLLESLDELNFGTHENNTNAGYGGYQGLRLVRQIKWL